MTVLYIDDLNKRLTRREVQDLLGISEDVLLREYKNPTVIIPSVKVLRMIVLRMIVLRMRTFPQALDIFAGGDEREKSETQTVN